MKCLQMIVLQPMLATGVLGLSLVSNGAFAQATHTHTHDHLDVVNGGRGFSTGSAHDLGGFAARGPIGRISTTPDNQILVELGEDTTAANLFDLTGRTLVFTPDGHGRYSRSIQSVAWEDDIGRAVADGEEIHLQSFMFDFAGRRWGSFFVSQRGVVTFGIPLTYSYQSDFDTMAKIAAEAFAEPTISPLYKPLLGGREDAGDTQYVASRPDRVVVTWITEEPEFRSRGVAPSASFQAVLHADGRIQFNYRDITLSDGVVGLFPNEDVVKGDLIVSIADARLFELPAHIDLLEAAIYESNTNGVFVEFTLRGPIPEPGDDSIYSYRVYVDADEPYFAGGDADLEIVWQIDVGPGGEVRAHGGKLLPRENDDSVAMLANAGSVWGTAVAFRAGTAEFDSSWRAINGDDTSVVTVEFPDALATARTDLSRPISFSTNHGEVFHHRPVDVHDVACLVVENLGDKFDLFVFHSEFRPDIQWAGMNWTRYGGNVGAIGIGDVGQSVAPCGQGRLKGQWSFPYWVDLLGFGLGPDYMDTDLRLFAHEFTHAWAASVSYDRNGRRERLFDEGCQCHWRWDLHVPAAFPWREEKTGYASLMGGRFWRDNGDGTWTPQNLGYDSGAGHSWLDLYLMGLAEANEVPDMFILHNARPVNEGDPWGPYTGDKEIVTIEQVVASEGPRVPSASEAQKNFNAGFVYLLEPGQAPNPDLLRLHAEYRDKVIEHWSHVTGGRSRMTTTVPDDDGPDAGGPTSPTEPGRTMPRMLDLTCHGYDEGATRAYNCIPEPSQQRFMGTFVPAVGSACDWGSIAEFPPGRIVFQIRCRDGSPGQSAAWSYSGRGPASFVTPAGTSRVRIRTSFPGSSVRLSVWCRAPQEHLLVNELLGAAWGNDGTSGIYGMAGCREVAVDTAREDLQWRFAQELAATALTPPRSWERVTGAGGDLSAEALQDLAAAAELERRWRRPGRSWMHPRPDASTRGAAPTTGDDGGARLDFRTAPGPDDGTDALDWAPFRATTRTVPLTLDLTCHGYDEGATRAYNCIPEPSQQHHMRTFVPAVGSACDQGSIAEFPPGRIVFQIRCRDVVGEQSAAWSHSGRGPAFFEKPTDTPRVWVLTSFSGSSVGLSVWCRGPQEHLVVNELLGRSWGNDGTEGLYDMAGCREVEVDTVEGENVQWSFTEELAATALTPPRSWEQASDTGMALSPEARQGLATAAALERLRPRPGR